jgi:hypothetical protein
MPDTDVHTEDDAADTGNNGEMRSKKRMSYTNGKSIVHAQLHNLFGYDRGLFVQVHHLVCPPFASITA